MPTTATKAAVGTVVSSPPLDHLSWSAISTYKRCPKLFQYRYLEHAPSERVGSVLVFGGAFHAAAEQIFQARLEGRPLPTTEELAHVFEQEWLERVTGEPEVVFGKKDSPETLKELAGRMLAAFREYIVQEEDQRVEILGVEHRARFKLLPGVPPLEMVADLVELHGEDLIITDLKTSRCRWNETKEAEGLPQLVLYASGLMPLLKAVGAKRVILRFAVITKGKKPIVQIIQPKPDNGDVARLKEQTSEVWSAIRAGAFIRNESWACPSCPFRVRCLGR